MQYVDIFISYKKNFYILEYTRSFEVEEKFEEKLEDKSEPFLSI